MVVNFAPCNFPSVVSVHTEFCADTLLLRNPLNKFRKKSARAKVLPQKTSYINQSYGALDGLSTSYSIVRFYFDVGYANTSLSSPDLIHDWLMTSEGLATAATEAFIIITLSTIANSTDTKDENQVKQWIISYWPYLRDTFKSIKNAYRTTRTTLQVIDNFFNRGLIHYTLPLSATLGFLAILNRCAIRYSRNERANKVKYNLSLLILIQQSPTLTADQCKEKHREIKYEGTGMCRVSLIAAFYSGLIDGLYLHMGMMTLTPLSPPLFIMAFSFSAFFSLLCIATRLYEICNEQRELSITQEKIKLLLCAKELERLLTQLQEESQNPFHPQKPRDEQMLLFHSVNQTLKALEKIQLNLQSKVSLSYTAAFLAGLRGGLAAYGALESLIFAIFTVTTLMFIPVPPLLIISGVIAGLCCLLGFSTYSVIQQHLHIKELKNLSYQSNEKLVGLITHLKVQLSNATPEVPLVLINDREICDMINEQIRINPSPQASFQEGFEILRSFFSGIGKGQKAVDFTLFSFQKIDEKGHYHDTPLMFMVMAVCSLFYSLVFAIRASSTYARAVDLKNNILKNPTIVPESITNPSDINTTALKESLELNTPPLPAERGGKKRLTAPIALRKTSYLFFGSQKNMPLPVLQQKHELGIDQTNI